MGNLIARMDAESYRADWDHAECVCTERKVLKVREVLK